MNKVCSSGLKCVAFGAMSIGLGLNNVVVAGGFESMSNVPFYIHNVFRFFSWHATLLIIYYSIEKVSPSEILN